VSSTRGTTNETERSAKDTLGGVRSKAGSGPGSSKHDSTCKPTELKNKNGKQANKTKQINDSDLNENNTPWGHGTSKHVKFTARDQVHTGIAVSGKDVSIECPERNHGRESDSAPPGIITTSNLCDATQSNQDGVLDGPVDELGIMKGLYELRCSRRDLALTMEKEMDSTEGESSDHQDTTGQERNNHMSGKQVETMTPGVAVLKLHGIQ
jgi:hypothetical protein